MSTETSPAVPAVVESPATSPRVPAAASPAPVKETPVRNERGQFQAAKSDFLPDVPDRTRLSPKAALKLDGSVTDDVTKALQAATKRVGLDRAQRNFEAEQEPKPEPKPKKAAKPAVSVPAAEATPAEPTPAPAAPPVAAPAATPAKVTVGGQEYTLEEVQAKLAEIEKTQRQKPAAPAPPAPPPPTAEEQAAAEQKWISELANTVEIPMTEEEIDTLLTGGEDAVALMQNMRKRDTAYAAVLAQKKMAEGINPVLQQLFSAMKPLVQHYESLQRYSVTQQFVGRHPDLKSHIDLATQVAETLMEKYPDQFNQLSDEAKMDEVARQTEHLLDMQWRQFSPTGSWRDAAKLTTPLPAPAAPPPPPAAPKPLAANTPGGNAAAAPKNWQSSVAMSLRR